MKYFKTVKILTISIILSMSLFLLQSFSQDTEKTPDSIDTTISDGYIKIKETRERVKEFAEGEIDEESKNVEGHNLEEASEIDNFQTPPAAEELGVPLQRPLYQSKGKRDPFKPFVKTPKESEITISQTAPPIKRFNLEEFRVVGVVWVKNEPKAMVVDPEKNTYFLGKNDEIGNRNGIILEVRENGLLVSEKRFFENVFGEQKVEIKKSVLAFVDEE